MPIPHAAAPQGAPMSLHAKLQQRAAAGRPVRIGLVGAGKFGAMYLAQVPRTPGVHLVGIADLSPDACAAQPGTRGLAGRTGRRGIARRRAARRHHPRRRRLDGAGATPGDRHRRRVHRLAGGRGGPLPRGVRAAQARGQRHRRGRRAVRPDAGGQGRAGGRGVFAGVRRPAGADLRPGGLGAHLRVSGGGGGPWPQVAAALLRIDARHRVGLLRAHPRAGRARRPEPEDVQQLPRRQQAVDRKHRGGQRHRPRRAEQRPAVPAGQHRRHPVRDAAPQRGRRARAQGHGRGDLVARGRRPRDPVRHPHGRVGHGRGRNRVHQELLRGVQRPHRPERPLLHALQALAPDRPGGRRLGGQRRAARRGHRRGQRAGMPTWWPPPSATCAPARCSTAKAATPCGASCCRRPGRTRWAACRWGWRTA